MEAIPSMLKPFEDVKQNYLLIHKARTPGEKLAVYDSWAEDYDQDSVVHGYNAAGHAAKSISSHFHGDREAAVVLDVACGTGQVAERTKTESIAVIKPTGDKSMYDLSVSAWETKKLHINNMSKLKHNGFGHFVGIDGCKAMLEEAQKKGLYQDLKEFILEGKKLPVQNGSFDVVVICGALGVEHVSISVVRELCIACKPGGYVCMTCRDSPDNLEYKAGLERELKQMVEEELWSCVAVTEVKNWARGVAAEGDDYSTGYVYLYKKL